MPNCTFLLNLLTLIIICTTISLLLTHCETLSGGWGEQEEGIILILYDQIQDSIKVLGNEMQPSVGGKSVEIFRLLDYDMRVTRPPIQPGCSIPKRGVL